MLLARDRDRLRLFVAEAHLHAGARRRNRKVPIAEPPHEVEGFSRWLLERHAKRVVRDALLDRGAHVSRRAEESIRGHQALDALVRTLEVVRLHEEHEPPRAVVEVRKHRARQKLLPQRLPESLDLAERLRVLRPALDLADALPAKLLLEARLTAPRRVLTALVGEHLLGRAEVGNGARERFEHQRRALMMRESVRDEEPTVIVHEGREVETLVASEQKREDVRLPELIGRGALEAPRRMLARFGASGCLGHQPLFVKDAAHLRLAHAERRKAREHVADATAAWCGVGAACREHRLPSHLLRVRRRARRRARRLRTQRLLAALLVEREPVAHRRRTRTEDACRLVDAHDAGEHLVDHAHSKRQRVRSTRTVQRTDAPLSLASLSLAHLRLLLSVGLSERGAGEVLSDLRSDQTGVNWRA